MASHEDMCQVCFEKKKCRTKYLGRAGLYVCSNPTCLATNLERRKVAKELALAEKAAKKKALDEAKAKARAKKMLAKARVEEAGEDEGDAARRAFLPRPRRSRRSSAGRGPCARARRGAHAGEGRDAEPVAARAPRGEARPLHRRGGGRERL